MDNGGGINSVITFDWLFSLLTERIGNIRLKSLDVADFVYSVY